MFEEMLVLAFLRGYFNTHSLRNVLQTDKFRSLSTEKIDEAVYGIGDDVVGHYQHVQHPRSGLG